MLETSARLLRLLSLLQTPRDWTGPELAERLQVTTRTVRNDVDRLRTLGYPVHATPGAAGGYRLGAGAAMPPLLLDDDEAVAITLSLRTTMDETALRALAKLEQVLPSRLRHRVAALQEYTVPVTSGPRVDADVLLALANACRAQERMRFDYVKHGSDVAERREVEPHRLAYARGRWYLVGWDVERDDWRTFRADRVAPRVPTGPRFAPRELADLPEYLTRGLATAPWQFRATVRVHAPASVIAARVPAAVVEAVTEDVCLLTVGSDSPEMLTLYLGMLDADFAVTGPPELVQALGKQADRFLRAIDTAGHG